MNYHSVENEISDQIENYRFDEALQIIWKLINTTDKQLSEDKPWELIGDLTNKKLYTSLEYSINNIRQIAFMLKPFLPDTAQKIEDQFNGPKIHSSEPLFPRINS